MVQDFSGLPVTTAPTRVQPTRSATIFYWLACVSTITTILYWRRPDAFYNPQLWAEDGSRFFSNPFFFGAQTLWMPFAGYYHTLARLVALVPQVVGAAVRPLQNGLVQFYALGMVLGLGVFVFSFAVLRFLR